MTVLSVDSSWFDFPMLQICNFTNSGHDGFAIKVFCLAVRRSLLHLSRRDLVSRFQPVSSSAATPVLRPSCNEHSLKRTGESDQLRTSPSRFSRDLAPIPCWVFLEMHSTSTQDFSKSLALLSFKQSDPTVPSLAGWDSTSRRSRNICFYHVFNTHARSHRKIDKNVSTRARASLDWSRATLNRNCRRDLFLQIRESLRAFTLLTPLRL